LTNIALRTATDAEVVRVAGPEAKHIVGTADGVAVAYIGFNRIGPNIWGMYHPFVETDRSVWAKLFYAFRRELRAHTEPVYVLARDDEASRVLRLLGFEPTGGISLGKEVWQWTPQH
jgi:hypothetical protein